jgi:hypothetical protein
LVFSGKRLTSLVHLTTNPWKWEHLECGMTELDPLDRMARITNLPFEIHWLKKGGEC